MMRAEALIGVSRAFAGALIFALPMLMTMELWWLGSYIAQYKLALLLVITIPLLTGVSWISGFEPNRVLADAVIDAFVAIAVGAVMSVTILYLFRIITVETPTIEVIGKVSVQTFPAGLGAALARSQLGQGSAKDKDGGRKSYVVTLGIMVVGALFLGLNVAPTQEVELLSYKMDTWALLALISITLLLMHAFVYALSFRGAPKAVPGATFWAQFARYTVVGYALVLLVSLYLLWTFGKTESVGLAQVISATVVTRISGRNRCCRFTSDSVAGVNMASKTQKTLAKPQSTSPVEWVFAAFGALFVVATIGYLLYFHLGISSAPPDIEFQIAKIVHRGDRYVVSFDAHNRSARTAASVRVAGTLSDDGRVTEKSEAVFDYIPALSSRRGGLLFRRDPSTATLELDALSYVVP